MKYFPSSMCIIINRCCIGDLWKLWFTGLTCKPYRLLTSRELVTEPERVLFSKAKAVMQLLIELDDQHRNADQIAQMSVADRYTLFQRVIVTLFKHFVYFDKCYTDADLIRMHLEIRPYITIYKHVHNFASDIDAEDDFVH